MSDRTKRRRPGQEHPVRAAAPKNARKIPHAKADIQALAASIAALGMLLQQINRTPDAGLCLRI